VGNDVLGSTSSPSEKRSPIIILTQYSSIPVFTHPVHESEQLHVQTATRTADNRNGTQRDKGRRQEAEKRKRKGNRFKYEVTKDGILILQTNVDSVMMGEGQWGWRK